MKPRVAAETTGGVAFILIFALVYDYSALSADFWYFLFAAAGFVGFIAYSAFPVAEVPIQAETTTATQSDFGPTISASDYPSEEFDKEKATDGVELVERLAKVNPIGEGDYSEMSYSYPGLKGKFVRGKAVQQEQIQQQGLFEPDFGALTPEPSPED